MTYADLCLSGVRAFLGVIRPEYRRVTARAVDQHIFINVEVEAPLSEDAADDIHAAGAEIVADFPHYMISENVQVVTGALPIKQVPQDVLIYRRWEA